jgi:hypothetical protein
MCEYDAEKDSIKVPEGFHDGVVAFFEKYKGKSSTNGRVQAVHDDWATLCQRIPWAEFGSDGSLRSNWENILKALKYFTGSSIEIPEKIQQTSKAVEILEKIALNCRRDVTFGFEEKDDTVIKCSVKRPESNDKQPNQKFYFAIKVRGGHSYLSSSSDSVYYPNLHRLLKLKNVMECKIVEHYQKQHDLDWVKKAEEFLQTSGGGVAEIYSKYISEYEDNLLPPSTFISSTYIEFIKDALLYTFDHIDLGKSSTDSTNNLLKPIKNIVDLLSKGKENEIRKFRDSKKLSSVYSRLFEKDKEEEKMDRFVTIINHLIALGEKQSEDGREALSTLTNIKDILSGKYIIFSKKLWADKLEFLKKNTVCPVFIYQAIFEDEFNCTVSEDGLLFYKMLACEFKKGGKIDLSRCKMADNYTYKLEYQNGNQSFTEEGEAKGVIRLNPKYKDILLSFRKKI